MSRRSDVLPGERAISPVVGGVLLIGIVLLLATVTGAVILGLTDEDPPAPAARLDVDSTASGCGFDLVHRGGDRIDGDNIEVKGIDDPDALDGETLTATDTVDVNPERDDLTVIWHAPEQNFDHVLARLEVNSTAGGGWACTTGTVITEDSGKLKVIGGDGSNDIELTNPTDVVGLGPVTLDLTDDGTTDVPYVTSNGEIKLTNKTNTTTTLTDGSDSVIDGDIAYQKTRLAVGEWNGSEPSVFFVDNNGNKIYRVAPGDSPQLVINPSNGANSVQGIADVDDDGNKELIFADDSHDLRYVDPDGSISELKNPNAGSSSGIGSGTIADFDGDDTKVVVVISGSNEIKIVGAKTSQGGEGTVTIPESTAKAAKSPVTVADVDGDGEDEIVYVGYTNRKIKYIDDVNGARTVHFLRDDDGDKIDGSDSSGVV